MLEGNTANAFPNHPKSGEIFVTKRKDSVDRVDFFPESGDAYLPRGTMLEFDRNILYVKENGSTDSKFRKATIMGEGILRLPDGIDISVHDLIPNQTAKVLLSSDIVDEDLERHGILEQ